MMAAVFCLLSFPHDGCCFLVNELYILNTDRVRVCVYMFFLCNSEDEDSDYEDEDNGSCICTIL